ncbi:unnamed protein product, partial [Pylaiella littoralis]
MVATPRTTPSSVISPEDDDDVQQVLSAGGDVAPSSAEVVSTATMPAFREALKLLSDPAALVRRQQDDPHLGQVCKDLSNEENRAGGDKSHGYCLDDIGVLRVEREGKKLPVIPLSMVPDVIALVHLFHGHAGVGATLHLVRRYFFWSHMARDIRHYVLSCGCRRRKRPTSRRVAMLPG